QFLVDQGFQDRLHLLRVFRIHLRVEHPQDIQLFHPIAEGDLVSPYGGDHLAVGKNGRVLAEFIASPARGDQNRQRSEVEKTIWSKRHKNSLSLRRNNGPKRRYRNMGSRGLQYPVIPVKSFNYRPFSPSKEK